MTDLNDNNETDLYTQIVAEQREKCGVCSDYPNYICGYHEAFFEGVEHVLERISTE